MLNKSVELKTFSIIIGSLLVVVVLSLAGLHFATNRNSVLATDEVEERTSSTSNSNTSSQLAKVKTSTTATTSTSISAPEVNKSTTIATAPSTSSGKNEIIFVGDSLLAQAGTPSKLVPKLAANDWQQISINAQGCRANHVGYAACNAITHFTTMLKEIENSSYDVYTSGSSVPGATQDVLKQLYADDQAILSKISDNNLNESFRQADTVVVSLGTNDDANAEKMEAGIRLTTSSIRTINPNIKIYWVKMCAQGNMESAGGIFNPLLDRLSQELSFQLIDWASQCQASYQYDGVHYNEQGVEAFTEALASGVN